METDMTRRMSSSLSTVILSVLVWSGCAVGPNYKRPTVDVPVTYREAATETPASSTRTNCHSARTSAVSGISRG